MKFFLKLFLAAGLLFSVVTYAETPSDTLTQLLGQITMLQADFSQTIVDKSGKVLQHATGKMSLVRPGKFRWDVKHPTAQLVVTNGRKLWVYDPDLEQVTVRVMTKEAGESPALLLSESNEGLSQKFNVHTLPSQGNLQWFLLQPRSEESVFDAIKLGFANNQIQQMELRDDMGHITRIQFSNVTTNAMLSDTLFNFKPPAHVDVIDETRR